MSDFNRKLSHSLNEANVGPSRSSYDQHQKAAHVTNVVDKPGLKIRLFKRSDDPGAAQILSKYAKQSKIGLVDPRMAKMYLSQGDIYIVFTGQKSFFIHPATNVAVDNDDREVDAVELFETLLQYIR